MGTHMSTHPRSTFDSMYGRLARALLDRGDRVDTGHWQALKDVPHTKTVELQNVQLIMRSLPSDVDGLREFFRPSWPWAEDHFQERVSGEPLNPGLQFLKWPWYRGGVEDHKASGLFSHTYMERFWPRRAGHVGEHPADHGRPVIRHTATNVAPITSPVEHYESDIEYGDRQGIRYRYGDLNDVVDLLAREPYTRQAYLPVWFPEDTGAHHGERVPCTLGYHFMLRGGRLNIFYPMRSVDFIRYLRDDLYMAARLGLWIIERLRETKTIAEGDEGTQHYLWDAVSLGELNFFASSLHIFQGPDEVKLRREHGGER